MTPNPILKVLFTFKKHQVKSLLIGGQACIIYGSAEFSRDSDFVILCTPTNLEFLQKALDCLKAELIYVPPLKISYLERGHACHFRCRAKEVENLRIDVISRFRGGAQFDILWKRKKAISLKGGQLIDVIGLRDLVQSKKTQRDKDWLMIRRLVENDIILNEKNPLDEQIRWWFLECREASRLIVLGKKYPHLLKECVIYRPLLSKVASEDIKKIISALSEEEMAERQKDIEYWGPLKKELEELRHKIV